MSRRFIQFEVWKDCNYNCPFCTSHGIPFKRDKTKSLLDIIDFLEIKGRYWDTISLIGGEIFDFQLKNADTKSAFYKVISCITDRIHSGHTNRVMVCTSLMYENNSYLIEFLNYLKGEDILSKFLLSTSWDQEYRFNKDTWRNWQKNMTYLKEFYPEISIHIQSILTQAFIENYNLGLFSVREFETRWDCSFAFNTPFKCWGKYKDKYEMENDLPKFFPKRKDFLNMLYNITETGDMNIDNILNVENHSSVLYHTTNDCDWKIANDRQGKNHTCVHTFPCKNLCCGYIDSELKIHEDANNFLNQVDIKG